MSDSRTPKTTAGLATKTGRFRGREGERPNSAGRELKAGEPNLSGAISAFSAVSAFPPGFTPSAPLLLLTAATGAWALASISAH